MVVAFGETLFWVTGVLLIVVSLIDIRYQRIPNMITLSGSALVLLFAAVFGVQVFFSSVVGLIIGIVCFTPLYVTGVVTAGDVKLIGFLGALVGVELIIQVVFWTLIAGGVLGLGCWLSMLRKKRMLPQLAHNNKKINTVSNSYVIPYAPAIALGTGIAIWRETGTIFGV